eukprot:403331586
MSSAQVSLIKQEEKDHLAKQCARMIKFLNSDHFKTPIESFVEEYCIIFAFEEDTDQESLKQKKNQYKIFKSLITRLIHLFYKHYKISEKQSDTNNDSLLIQVMTNSFYCDQIDEEVVQYLFAIEEFEVFCIFMAQENQRLNELTMSELKKQGSLKDSNNYQNQTSKQQLEYQDDNMRRQKTVDYSSQTNKGLNFDEIIQKTQGGISEKELYEIALKESMDDQQKREQHKQLISMQEETLMQQMLNLSEREAQDRLRREQLEEDEMMRKIMEESLRLEQERVRKEQEELEKLQQQMRDSELKSLQQKQLHQEQEEAKQAIIQTQQDSVQRSVSHDINLNPLKMNQYAKVQPVIIDNKPDQNTNDIIQQNLQNYNQQETQEEDSRESYEERQKRLKIQRDILRAQLNNQEETKQTPFSEIPRPKTGSTVEDKVRMSRCINVLRQAANDMMFQGKAQDKLDINYYNRDSQNEEEDLELDQSIIFLNKGRKKHQNKQNNRTDDQKPLVKNNGNSSKGMIIDLGWREDEFD